MKFENTETWGFDHAIRSLYNSVSSESKSDSGWKGFCTEINDWVSESCSYDACFNCCDQIKEFFIGPNDLGLMQRLIKLGDNHREFLDKIFVSVDITAPLYWWRGFSGTVPVSTEISSKLVSTPVTIDCFEMGDFIGGVEHESLPYSFFNDYWDNLIKQLERVRKIFIETNDNKYLKELIRLLPQSWLETRTIAMTYNDILLMIRNNESLITEWAKSLPYSEELLFI